MAGSAANEAAHRAALTPEAKGNLLTDKTRGTNDEIHKQPPLYRKAILANKTIRKRQTL